MRLDFVGATKSCHCGGLGGKTILCFHPWLVRGDHARYAVRVGPRVSYYCNDGGSEDQFTVLYRLYLKMDDTDIARKIFMKRFLLLRR